MPQTFAKVLILLTVLPFGWTRTDRPVAAAESKPIEFNRDIRPILSENCFQCHGPDERARQAGLRFDKHEPALAQLESGKWALKPGSSSESELIARVTSADADLHMPPAATGKVLTAEQIDLLKRWIDGGAQWQDHWSFIAPQRPELPKLDDANHWVRNPIDVFVLDRLNREQLAPSPEADKATLLRRVTLDLTGLPPTLAELDVFLADGSSEAYERVVERLLASPHYGERMALPWLDAARYADTNGYNNDEPRVMWPWRDWVIAAFNDNKPYSEFLTEQIAGDLLPNATADQKLATAFNRNNVLTTEGGIVEEEYRVEYVADRVHTTATVFLGLSMGCARCHDHKFDPLKQSEYYQFFAFFNQMPHHSLHWNTNKAAPPVLAVLTKDQQAERAKLESERTELKAAATVDMARVAELTKAIEAIDAVAMQVMVMEELASPRETHLLGRGDYDKPLEVVTAGTPASLSPYPADAPRNRLGLAKWLVDPQNPLTARVAVNRFWSLYFNRGIVETLEDFGSQGAWPSHPELLDWLATEFIRTNWDVKALQKLIVMSATYRQSSDVSAELHQRDPDNRLLARGARFRLPGEMIRDQALAASGLIVPTIGGPSVMPYQPEGLWEEVSVERKFKYEIAPGPGLYRRGMYTFWKRTCPPPAMTTFDAPDRESCVARRATTNTPLQALVLLNDPSFIEAARLLGEKMLRSGGSTAAEQIRYGMRSLLSRDPSEQEAAVLLKVHVAALNKFQANADATAALLKVGTAPLDAALNPAELAALTTVANVMLNLDEVVTRK